MSSEEIPFCPEPFTFLSRDPIRFLTCCPSWLHESRFVYGDFDNLWDVWNHPNLVELREAVGKGDYRWCQKCPNRFRKRDRDAPLPDEKPVMERPPITYQFQDNATCNLHCPSCRHEVLIDKRPIVYGPERIVRDFPEIQTVAMSLSGDPFVTKEYLKFLQQEGSPPDVILWTNGLLLPKYWPTVRRKVTVVLMSVDGATAGTYEKLRRGGKWEDINRSMKLGGELVRDPDSPVQIFQLNFVVQADNFREMPAFVRMGLGYGATCVQFTPIAPWPHMSQEYWQRANISDPSHPEFRDYVEVLHHPDLKLPGVDAGFVTESALEIYAKLHPDCNLWGDPLWETLGR